MGEVTRERRLKVKEITALLRSDLYQRIPDPDPSMADERAVWRAPGGLLCICSYDAEAEHQPVRCELVDSRGQAYASTEDADASWLDQEMY